MTNKKLLFVFVPTVAFALLTLILDSYLIGLGAFVLLSVILLVYKKLNYIGLIGCIFLLLTFFVANTFYYQPSTKIAASYGPILTQNWLDALTWLKNNTDECVTVATYWDPGHFITALARRAVVFDGASQGDLRTITVNGTLSEDDVKKVAVIDKYKYEYAIENGKDVTKVSTARIQDIATTLFTDNESLAVEILKKYRKPGCKEMYYIASSDLIGKSVWWSYFATWNQETKGNQYSYSPVYLSQQGKAEDGGDVNIYRLNNQQAILLYQKNSTVRAIFQEGGRVADIKKLAVIRPPGEVFLIDNPNATQPGMVWVTSDLGVIVYIPTEIENSLFTKMFLFDGLGLQQFKYVSSWGGEVKLFKLTFDDI